MHRGAERKMFLGFVIFFMSFLLIPTALFAGPEGKKSKAESKNRADFKLTIENDLISLTAHDASIKKIIEEIGSKMKIEAVVHIPEQEKVTIEFKRLSLQKALKKLNTNSMQLEDRGKITKIIVYPEGTGTAPLIPEEESKVKEEKVSDEPENEEEKSPVSEKPSQPKEESDKEKPKRPKPFKFEFDPSDFKQKEK